MAGLVPAIHVFWRAPQDVDTRDEPAHDGVEADKIFLVEVFR